MKSATASSRVSTAAAAAVAVAPAARRRVVDAVRPQQQRLVVVRRGRRSGSGGGGGSGCKTDLTTTMTTSTVEKLQQQTRRRRRSSTTTTTSTTICGRMNVVVRASSGEDQQQQSGGDGTGGGEFKQNTEFGRSRKDVLLICAATLALPFGLRSFLESTGMDPLRAGSTSVAIFMVVVMLGYTSTYLFRVGRKEMTYITQLKEYEEAVMVKRLEEMPAQEVDKLMKELEEEDDS